MCEIGFDRSLIGGYGHDDRVCAYAELKALFDVNEPERTCVCILADKEEIGSDGVTGMQSAAFDCFMEDLCAIQGVDVRRCFENSFCLSADVTAAFDPLYPEAYEKSNDAKLNYGMGICKFTGARGKSGTSDASAEIVAYLRRLFDKAGVVWQLTEMGKVDLGGGGTIAKYMANRNIDTIDAGVPVLSMHAPFEVVSKLDCYMTYKGVRSVLRRIKINKPTGRALSCPPCFLYAVVWIEYNRGDEQMAESENKTAEINEVTELGQTRQGSIHCLSIIGQIEGHQILPEDVKTTKYEHVLPMLAAIEESPEITGLLILLNTVGGDVEAGLAIGSSLQECRHRQCRSSSAAGTR